MRCMNYKTKTSLKLPFKVTLVVGNGGRGSKVNNHYSSKSQRYAYDFMSLRVKNKGEDLKDFEIFGIDVIAPGAGVISQVIRDCGDMEIGKRDKSVYTGNMVVIDHGNGEWSVLCHFKYNSIKVKERDRVRQGDVFGLCGNTGNSSEPHIHYHLQDNALMLRAKGLPTQFSKIMVDGLVKDNVEPVRYQKVSNIK